jgi:glycosyltransferase involved in cell wall biosynthesis
MPVYNDYLYLVEAIDSVLNQSYSNLVLIVVNDGSNVPEVNQILSEYSHNPKIVAINLEQN